MSELDAFRRRLAYTLLTPREDGRLEWTGRLLLWILLLWFGLEMLATSYEDVVTGTLSGTVAFLHRIDLVFHEAGHVIFRLFGDFMAVLGGSLMQIIVPLIVGAAFLIKNTDPFGASVGLWWTGQSLSDVAPYVGDARALRLPLLGGGTGADRPGFHDWHNIFSRLDLLEYDKVIAGVINFTGIFCMGLALAWGAALLWRQYQMLH